MKTVAFVPVKLNNERLHGKNTRSFTNGKPLISYILDTLCKVTNVDDIYVYCSDESIKTYLPNNVKFLKRETYLDLSTTSFNEVLRTFAEKIEADVYVLTHATAPFITKETIECGINKVLYEGYDSALSVLKMQEFLWKDNKPFNYQLSKIPRTQDLEPIYKETCGLYVYNRDLIINKNRRIGDNPYLIEVSQTEACDINTYEDFEFAEFCHKKIYGGGYVCIVVFKSSSSFLESSPLCKEVA